MKHQDLDTLIEQLQQIRKEHGNLKVETWEVEKQLDANTGSFSARTGYFKPQVNEVTYATTRENIVFIGEWS